MLRARVIEELPRIMYDCALEKEKSRVSQAAPRNLGSEGPATWTAAEGAAASPRGSGDVGIPRVAVGTGVGDWRRGKDLRIPSGAPTRSFRSTAEGRHAGDQSPRLPRGLTEMLTTAFPRETRGWTARPLGSPGDLMEPEDSPGKSTVGAEEDPLAPSGGPHVTHPVPVQDGSRRAGAGGPSGRRTRTSPEQLPTGALTEDEGSGGNGITRRRSGGGDTSGPSGVLAGGNGVSQGASQQQTRRDELESMRVRQELWELCREYSLPRVGRKGELIDRILAHEQHLAKL